MPTHGSIGHRLATRVVIGVTGGLLILAGCGAPRRNPVSVTWVVGQPLPAFDPQGPPDPVRWALERLLSRGLVEEDSTGRIVPAAAESIRVSTDGLIYTFILRPGLAFGDGKPCASSDFRVALERGISRLDHATQSWLLSALVGMDKFRAGRPLPPLGIATPDPHTLVLRLARPDPLLLRKLALPGVGTPWRAAATGEGWSPGIGDYDILGGSGARGTSRAPVPPGWLTLVRRGDPGNAPDTIHVRFAPGAGRVRSLLRSGAPDLLWPVPPRLLDEPLPRDYRAVARPTRPARRLLLVLRADLPPTSRPAARHALVHGLNRGELIAELGPSGGDLTEWLPGGEPFAFPKHDPEEVRGWLERGKLGRSLHVVMAYSADGVAVEVSRPMQVEWARLGLDVELRPLSGAKFSAEALRFGGAQALLIDSQSLLDDPATDLATLVMPWRGPVVGAFRTGWATRDFDRWIGPRADTRPDVAFAQQRLAEEHVVLPLARLPWLWVERDDRPPGFHPHFGPEVSAQPAVVEASRRVARRPPG